MECWTRTSNTERPTSSSERENGGVAGRLGRRRMRSALIPRRPTTIGPIRLTEVGCCLRPAGAEEQSLGQRPRKRSLPVWQAECLRRTPLIREAAGRWPVLRGGRNPGRRYALPRALLPWPFRPKEGSGRGQRPLRALRITIHRLRQETLAQGRRRRDWGTFQPSSSLSCISSAPPRLCATNSLWLRPMAALRVSWLTHFSNRHDPNRKTRPGRSLVLWSTNGWLPVRSRFPPVATTISGERRGRRGEPAQVANVGDEVFPEPGRPPCPACRMIPAAPGQLLAFLGTLP